MSKKTLREFLADRNLMAIKVSSRELAGFFRKSLTIPRHTAGLATFDDGTNALFEEGRRVSGKFDLVLVKTGEFPIHFEFADLRSSDGLPVCISCVVCFSPAAGRDDLLGDFCRSLFDFPGAYSSNDLKTRVNPEARRIASQFAASKPAADLHRADLSGTLGAAITAGLERHLFDAGVRVVRLAELEASCAEHEMRAAEERRRRQEELRAVEILERKEERLRRLAAMLSGGALREILSGVRDDRLKGLLYAKLMEDDFLRITADDLVSKARDCGEEAVQAIYKAMENLLRTGASVEPDEVESSLAGRLYAAAGSKVLEIDPAGSAPRGILDFRSPLRSVRLADTPSGPLILCGAKAHVAAAAPGGGGGIMEFPLPDGRNVRGGINSIAAAGEHIYATHSEYGLARWRADRPGETAEILYPDITGANRTTRAVQALDGRIIFASGQHVYMAPACRPGEPVKFVSSVESPVTCAAAAARTIFAGTENGSIICWRMDAPDQPVVLVRKREPVVAVRLARICAIPHLVYSTRDLSVRARVLGQNLETSYETGGAQVGTLDAASDLICAADAGGRRLFLWKSTAPSRPSAQIDVWKEAERPVIDLWMSKIRSGGPPRG